MLHVAVRLRPARPQATSVAGGIDSIRQLCPALSGGGECLSIQASRHIRVIGHVSCCFMLKSHRDLRTGEGESNTGRVVFTKAEVRSHRYLEQPLSRWLGGQIE